MKERRRMRRVRWVTLPLATVSVLVAGVAPASADIQQNPNARTLTLTCPFGEVVGSTAGGALLLEGGGVFVAQGNTTTGGVVLVPINPGLSKLGKLVQCTYFSELRNEEVVAYLFIP
jgi:hypothetical protein